MFGARPVVQSWFVTADGVSNTGASGRRDRALVAVALTLGFIDFFAWGLAASFGSGGFGGDQTPTELELLNARIAGVAALVACILGLAAPLSVLATTGAIRTKVLTAIVGIQIVATAALAFVLFSF